MPNNVNIVEIPDTLAEELLQRFLDEGRLRIITSEVNPDGNPDPVVPDHFVIHDVVSLEKNHRDHWVATTAEGDSCEAYDGPQSLLVRCLEAEFGRHVRDSKGAAVNGIIAAALAGREPG